MRGAVARLQSFERDSQFAEPRQISGWADLAVSDSTASVRPNHLTKLNGEFDEAITGLDGLLGNSR